MKKVISAMAAFIIILMVGRTQVFAQENTLFLPEESEYDVTDDRSIVVNRTANVQGLTGLIMTNSAYTQEKGRIVVGLASIAENSRQPDFSIIQGIATITVGITDRIEVGLKAQMVGINLGSSLTREIGAGDTDLLFKWRISSQGEYLPAIAIGLAYTFPTGNYEKGFQSVGNKSGRFMLIGTTEQEMPGSDYFIGIYFEGQVVQADRPEKDNSTDKPEQYGIINAGLLFPLTEGRSLQAILEYNTVVKKDYPSVYEQNYSAVMPGLRFVTENLNLSLGVQMIRRDPELAIEDGLRYIGTLSYAF